MSGYLSRHRRRMRRRLYGRVFAAAVVAGGAFQLAVTPSRALFGVGDVVFDPANFGQAVEQVAQLTQQIAKITEYISLATRLVHAVGERGPIGALPVILNAADEYGLMPEGVRDFMNDPDVKNVLDTARGMQDLYSAGMKLYEAAGDATGAAQRFSRSVGQAASYRQGQPLFVGSDVLPTLGQLSTVYGSRSYSYGQLGAYPTMDAASRRAVEQRRNVEGQNAALDLHAISLHNQQAAASAADRVKELTQAAYKAESNRQAATVQTLASLALLEEIAALRMQMAVQGRATAASQLAGRDLDRDRQWPQNARVPQNGGDLMSIIFQQASSYDNGCANVQAGMPCTRPATVAVERPPRIIWNSTADSTAVPARSAPRAP